MTRRRNLSPAQSQRLEADRQRNLDRLHHRLSEQVKQLHHGQGWRDWLTVASKFHRYSWRNSLLIQMQCPDATTVAGYNTWKSLGRQVDKGQRGLQILAPLKRRTTPRQDQQQPDSATPTAEDQLSQTHPRVVGYRVTHVWDLSQTSGQPLPLPPQPQLLHGQAPTGLWAALAKQADDHGYTLERGHCADANGWTDFRTRTIRVRGDVDPAQAVKTLAHEIAHMRVHDPASFDGTTATCRGTAEVEAESIAYLVAGAHGMPTDEYTFPYVATWAAAAEQPDEIITRTAERVVGTARQIIDCADLTTDPLDPGQPHDRGKDREAADLGRQSHRGGASTHLPGAVLPLRPRSAVTTRGCASNWAEPGR